MSAHCFPLWPWRCTWFYWPCSELHWVLYQTETLVTGLCSTIWSLIYETLAWRICICIYPNNNFLLRACDAGRSCFYSGCKLHKSPSLGRELGQEANLHGICQPVCLEEAYFVSFTQETVWACSRAATVQACGVMFIKTVTVNLHKSWARIHYYPHFIEGAIGSERYNHWL